MARGRALSFLAQWTPNGQGSPAGEASANDQKQRPRSNEPNDTSRQGSAQYGDLTTSSSPQSPSMLSRIKGELKSQRTSMLQAYRPAQVEAAKDTPAELQPIFTHLNDHSNKLYQEGYFLKLHDLDTKGRPTADRTWADSFGQLIGTVLSIWDAAALDAAGKDDEVIPNFVNLSDATIKMMDTMPITGGPKESLPNVLSLSTAANNRYLLHFNNSTTLTQWTAAIRLAMFEHSSLQEAYTGSLIAGKGRELNGIKQIMFPLKFPYGDWARVRFGAGTPWQRYWCVISPPDEKEQEKAKKAAKKATPYEKTKPLRGDIRFYDTRKLTKKTKPVAIITDVFAAYAIYPQSIPLIEQSTLVKLEGVVSMTDQQVRSEGFLFVMPEVHNAVSGFEMMLRWLFPAFDTFGLYGRPNKMIADTLDMRGLMFAMPRDQQYGVLDKLDVSALINTKGSDLWTARHWRRELKKLTADKMMNGTDGQPRDSSQGSHRGAATARGAVVSFGDRNSDLTSSDSKASTSPDRNGADDRRTQAPGAAVLNYGNKSGSPQKRAVSDGYVPHRHNAEPTPRLSIDEPPTGRATNSARMPMSSINRNSFDMSPSRTKDTPVQERMSLKDPSQELYYESMEPANAHQGGSTNSVHRPPAFTRQAESRPTIPPHDAPELRRANSNVDAETLREMRDARNQQQASPEEATWADVMTERQQPTVPLQDANQGLAPSNNRSQGNADVYQHYHRLSTIPASPFVGSEVSYFESPRQTDAPQFPSVAEEQQTPPIYVSESPPEDSSMLAAPLNSSRSFTRKPVPKPLPNVPQDERPSTASSLERLPPSRSLTDPTNAPAHMGENWEHMIINEVALEPRNGKPFLDQKPSTNGTVAQSGHTFDFYSSSRSTKPKEPIERPRAGKLKTVGTADYSAATGPTGVSIATGNTQLATPVDIPTINFGPTYDYTRVIGNRPPPQQAVEPTSRVAKRRSVSADRLLTATHGKANQSHYRSSRSSPNDSKRSSYFDEQDRRSSPDRRAPTPDRRTPTPNGRRTPEPYSNPATAVWRGPSPQPGPQPMQQPVHRYLSPEEWVQQKALAAQAQQYAPPRSHLPSNPPAYDRSSSVDEVAGRKKLLKTAPVQQRHLSDDAARSTPSPVVQANGTRPIPQAQDSNQQKGMTQENSIGAAVQKEKDKSTKKPDKARASSQPPAERQKQPPPSSRRVLDKAAQEALAQQVRLDQLERMQKNERLLAENQQKLRQGAEMVRPGKSKAPSRRQSVDVVQQRPPNSAAQSRQSLDTPRQAPPRQSLDTNRQAQPMQATGQRPPYYPSTSVQQYQNGPRPSPGYQPGPMAKEYFQSAQQQGRPQQPQQQHSYSSATTQQQPPWQRGQQQNGWR